MVEGPCIFPQSKAENGKESNPTAHKAPTQTPSTDGVQREAKAKAGGATISPASSTHSSDASKGSWTWEVRTTGLWMLWGKHGKRWGIEESRDPSFKCLQSSSICSS